MRAASSSCSPLAALALAAPARRLERRPLRRPGRRLADRTGRARSRSGSTARAPRRRHRPLHGALGPGRARAAGAAALVGDDGLPLGLRRRRARRGCTTAASHAVVRSTGRPAGRTAAGARTARRRRAPTSPTSPHAAAKRYPWVRDGRSGTSRTSALAAPDDGADALRPALLNPAYTALHRPTRARASPAASRRRAGTRRRLAACAWIRGMRRRGRGSTPTRTTRTRSGRGSRRPFAAAALRDVRDDHDGERSNRLLARGARGVRRRSGSG